MTLPEPTLNSYLMLSAVLFAIGTAGVFLRRNIITILLSIEVMLNAVGIAPYFDAIVAAEDVTVGKPDPQVFLIAARRLGVPPSRCVVVEDARAGIDAAHAGGMPSIGVSAAAVLPATVFVRSLADLPPNAFGALVP